MNKVMDISFVGFFSRIVSKVEVMQLRWVIRVNNYKNAERMVKDCKRTRSFGKKMTCIW